MFRIYGCIANQHDLRLVVLAGLICALACFTAFSLSTRVGSTGWSRHVWLAAVALVAGCGIWATHFIGMLAFEPGLPASYDLSLTLLSVVIAIVVSGAGFLLAVSLSRPILGGAIVGLAVGAMHFTGMAALRVPADAHWDAAYVIAALLIGVVFGAAALKLGSSRQLSRRFGAAGLLTLAICGLHFTAMAAVSFTANPLLDGPNVAAGELGWLAIIIAVMTLLIIGAGFAGALVDEYLAHRSASEAERLRIHVTELEAAKTELESTTRQLTKALEAAAGANQAKSQFLATMSHELRTPLNAIIGFSDIMRDGLFGPLTDRYRDYSVSINDSGKHLLNLIDDILDISKLDTGHFDLSDDLIDIAACIGTCLKLVELQAEKGQLRLRPIVDTGLPHLLADERRLTQILLNLLSNAIKFTPEGGDVQIAAYLIDDGLAIAITDTGIGMAPHEIPLALERFGQIDNTMSRKYEGTGLGLPLAKHLIELHGGSLAIESHVGVGTSVTITLPADRLRVDKSGANRAVA